VASIPKAINCSQFRAKKNTNRCGQAHEKGNPLQQSTLLASKKTRPGRVPAKPQMCPS
jgi:hypothetical protein